MAIVLAMSVVALASLGATAILVSQSTWAREAELATARAQSQLVVRAGLDWARAVLSDDRRQGEIDHAGESWALRLPTIPVENGSLAGRIEDQQGRFNLNNLQKEGRVSQPQLEQFQRLLAILGLPPALAGALADWIDSDTLPQPQDGAEDAAYLALGTPRLAANRPLLDVAELALVLGFDGHALNRLRPFVTALPRFTTVNVNTAPPEVLCAIVENLPLDEARAITAQRDAVYFRTAAEFVARLPRGLAVSREDISVGSDYFIATMQASIGGAQAQGSALLARDRAGWPAIVWRKLP